MARRERTGALAGAVRALRNRCADVWPYLVAASVVSLTAGAQMQAAALEPKQPHLTPLDTTECRALLRDDASVTALREAAARSLEYLQTLPPDRALPALDRRVTVAELMQVLHGVRELSARGSDWTVDVCTRFRVHRAELPATVLITGYYQPELPASLTRTERFRYPLYARPHDLVDIELGQFCAACADRTLQGRVQDGRLLPYYSRAEIEAGALAGRDHEVAWLDDPVEAFFLHVQGSGLLRFDDGTRMQVSYSSANGRPYTSIGRLLVQQGKVAPGTASLQGLKAYLRTHPEERAAVMAANQRYIFFRAVPVGPIGSIGVLLTAGRSIAADPTVYPQGGLAFLRIAPRTAPAAPDDQTVTSRFTVIQDAGAAISGPHRIDVFWGAGTAAEAIAGDMRNPGEFYLVLAQ